MVAPTKPREFQFSNAKQLLNDEFSCLNILERTVPIRLPPKYLGKLREFAKLTLDGALGHYDYELQCIPVSYTNVRQLGATGIICGEDPNVYFSILVEYIVFQPVVGSRIAARVEKISKSHVGLLAHGWFNCSVTKNGSNDSAAQLNVGDDVIVEVLRININRRLLSLECRLERVVKKAEVEIQVGAESITKDPSSKIAETETAEAMEQTSNQKNGPHSEVNGSDSGIEQTTPYIPVTAQSETQETSSVVKSHKKKHKRKHSDLEEEELASPVRKKSRSEISIHSQSGEALSPERTESLTSTSKKKKKKKSHDETLDSVSVAEDSPKKKSKPERLVFDESEDHDASELKSKKKKKKKHKHD